VYKIKKVSFRRVKWKNLCTSWWGCSKRSATFTTFYNTFTKNIREVLCSQHFYNIFTTNHRWLVVIGLNLNLALRLLF